MIVIIIIILMIIIIIIIVTKEILIGGQNILSEYSFYNRIIKVLS